MSRAVFNVLIACLIVYGLEKVSSAPDHLRGKHKQIPPNPGRVHSNGPTLGRLARSPQWPYWNPHLNGMLKMDDPDSPRSEESGNSLSDFDVNPMAPNMPLVAPVKSLINPNETEAERTERIHRTYEKLLTFVEIVGQVDNYVSNKWKNFVKTVSNLYSNEEENDDIVGSSRRRRKTCRSCEQAASS